MIVDLMPTEEQAMIADSVRTFFAERLPLTRLRAHGFKAGEAENAAWSDLAALGIFGLGVAEARGGVGYSLAEEVVVATLAGQFLISPSLLATMIAAHLHDAADYADGRRAAFANLLPEGSVAHLLDSVSAEDLVLCAPDGLRLFSKKDCAPEPVASMDATVPISRATLDLSQTSQVAGDDIVARTDLLLAAYLVGISRTALNMAVEYAKVREQFGQPIGAFQAIKHACADMALRTESAYSQVCYTAAVAGSGEADPQQVACAKLLAREAALANARANIQIHGGMGFTDESDAHHLLKRALLFATLNGSKYVDQARILAG